MSNLSGFVKRLRDIMRNDAGINGDAQRIEQIAWMLFLKVYDAKEQDWEFDDEGYVSIIPEECRWRNWAVDDRSGNAMTGDALMDIFARFGKIRHLSPESQEAQELVASLQDFITRHYYTCTKPILQGLGQLYIAGDSMTENIDKAGGEGTSRFAHDAIEIFCR